MNERTIFLEALDQPTTSQRAAFLDQACGANLDLRQKVEALLQAHGDAGSFIEHSAFTPEATQRAIHPNDDTDPQTALSSGADSPLRSATPTGIPLNFLTPSEVPGHLGKLGSYEILEVIGRGAFGIVLRALDPKLHRVVAIKVLAPELASNPRSVRQFLNEAVAAAAVSHDHVVTIHAIDDSTALPFLVMECIIGQSLQQKIEKSGPLPIEEVLRIGMQIAFGLAAAHKQGLVHRDIKPANILLENGVQRVKITDFGLARSLDDLAATQTFQVAGTPQYMSPEQAHGDSIDQRSDLFSLGSVMYAMCTGRPAFRAESVMGILKRVCDEIPSPIPESNPCIPEWLDYIVARLMAKRPEDRYQTAAEVAELLRNRLADVQQGREIFSPPPPKPIPLPLANYANSPREPSSNVPVLLLVLLTLGMLPVLLLVLGIAGYFFMSASISPSNDRTFVVQGSSDWSRITTVEPEVVNYKWQTLFDGLDISEWQPNDHWIVEDELFVSRVLPDATTSPPMLTTVRNDFRNFHAKIEAKIHDGGDSGLFFRFGERGDRAIQAQITASPAGTGSLLRNTDTIVKSPLHVNPNEWFTLEVIAQGSSVLVIVDGTEVARWVDRSPNIEAGPLAFESGFAGTEIAIRKVEVKTLPPLNVAPLPFTTYVDASVPRHEFFCADRTLDGKVVLAGDAGGEVLAWKEGTDAPSYKLSGHEKPVYGVVAFPDNRRAVSSSGDGTIQMWDLTTGQKTGPEFAPVQGGRIDQLLVTPDGTKIITACVSYQKGTSANGLPAENAVRMWDCETGKMVREFPNVRGPVDGLTLSANGKRLLASDGWSDMLLLWDVETGSLLHSVHQPAIRRMAFSPDGHSFVAAHYPTEGPASGGWDDVDRCVISLWDTDTLTRRKTFRGHASPVCGMGFLSNGSQIVSLSSGAFDRQGQFHPASDATMRVWDVASGEELWQYPIGVQVQALRVVGPREVLTSGNDSVRLWTLPPHRQDEIVPATNQ
jgi:serine/threonine protein kinase/WD40 repeat protein